MAYIRTFFAAAIALAIVFLGIGLYLGPQYGDLTRLANLAERDFGWRAGQPAVRIAANSASDVPTAIVLGDSFSEQNVWQSVAAERTGQRFLTFDWNDFREPDCLGPWLRSLKAGFPAVRLVVLETAERELLLRFASKKRCRHPAALVPRASHAGTTTSLPAVDPWNVMSDPFYALRALYGTVRRFETATTLDDAVVAPLTRRDLFSNRRSDLLLYYRPDDTKWWWRTERMIELANALATLDRVAASQGIALLVVVVPDKSTAYGAHLRQPQFPGPTPDAWKILASHQVAIVALREPVMDAAARTVDFYMPNDTHFSTTGYRFLGEAIAARIATMASATPRTP